MTDPRDNENKETNSPARPNQKQPEVQIKGASERVISPSGAISVQQTSGPDPNVELDPRLMNDVIEICQQEATRMNNNKNAEKPHGILRKKKVKKQKAAQLTFSESSSETTVMSESADPSTLIKTPQRPNVDAWKGNQVVKPKS